MEERPTIQHMWDHAFWADEKLMRALLSGSPVPPEAVREFAHVTGAEEVWLSRLEHRSSNLAVWPTIALSELEGVVQDVHARWKRYLKHLQPYELWDPVRYENSAGQRFESTVEDILIQVTMHAQYHRGKVNLMLRRADLDPAPVDYIAFVRGAPAATEAEALRRRGSSSDPRTL